MTFFYVAIGTLIAIATGIAFRIVLGRSESSRYSSITGTELVLGSLICALVVAPAVTSIGFRLARTHTATYHEWWSSKEKSHHVETTPCSKDGSCHQTYDCDKYQVPVTKTRTVPDGTDANGNPKTRTETYIEYEDRWHSCPYVEAEYTYTITDEAGETYTFGDHWFPADPDEHRWRGSGYNEPRWGWFSMPDLPDGVHSGEPKAWVEARNRIDAGHPIATHSRHDYKNYIQASAQDIYEKSSDAIDGYLAAGQLPRVATEIHDEYLADKVAFVGPVPTGTTEEQWQIGLMDLNGDVGPDRHGDVDAVVVTDPTITDPDEYTQALDAYWQSPALGKDTLSKNGIVVVIGVSPAGTVSWSRAFTGMPAGNERLLVDLGSDLDGLAATPAALFTDGGAIRDLILAPDGGFVRVEMADYDSLWATIQPGGLAKFLVLLVGFILAVGVWSAFVFLDIRLPEEWTAPIRNWIKAGQPQSTHQDTYPTTDRDRGDPDRDRGFEYHDDEFADL